MSVIINGGAGVTFPDAVQQTNGMTNTGGNPPYYAARAWVNFNGTGTVSISAAVNVSSITDRGTGQYTVNFTAAMVDANYAAAGMEGGDNDSGRVVVAIDSYAAGAAQIRVQSTTTGGVTKDANPVTFIVFR